MWTDLEPQLFSSISRAFELHDLKEKAVQVTSKRKNTASLSLRTLSAVHPAPTTFHLMPPIADQEVWGAGETFEREASQEPDASPEDRAYYAERPELFFKATPNRVVGPNGGIRVREDATLTFPEPELALVVNSRAEVVGYTIALDVSAYDFYRDNFLYMPQTKIYNGSCALGPTVLLATSDVKLQEFVIELTIERDGVAILDVDTNVARLKRKPADLLSYLFREQEFPHGVILMTGLGFEPPQGFSIQPGDSVRVTIAGIGTLCTAVV